MKIDAVICVHLCFKCPLMNLCSLRG